MITFFFDGLIYTPSSDSSSTFKASVLLFEAILQSLIRINIKKLKQNLILITILSKLFYFVQ